MLATLIDFLPSNGNPNKKEEKSSEFLYLLNPNDKMQSVLNFDEIIVVRYTDIDIRIGMTQFR